MGLKGSVLVSQVCVDIRGDIPGGEEGRPPVAAGFRFRLQVLLSCVGGAQEK